MTEANLLDNCSLRNLARTFHEPALVPWNGTATMMVPHAIEEKNPYVSKSTIWNQGLVLKDHRAIWSQKLRMHHVNPACLGVLSLVMKVGTVSLIWNLNSATL
jgi:hypothetical protein